MRSEPAYMLVTPTKNEGDSLPGLVESIVNQKLRPVVWCIVDDGSTDRSPAIIRQAALDHPWIYAVTLDTRGAYDLGRHYASVCATGFDHVLAYCERNSLEFGYIALSDADMTYPEDYFIRCIGFLGNNPEFGIVSGTILVRDAEKAYEEDRIELGHGAPFGTGRVWSKECFADTGGYIVTKSPDTVSNAKAVLRGWKIKRLSDVVCYQTRETGGKQGLWDGYLNRGQRAHYLGAAPLSVLNTVVDMMLISRPKGRTTRSLALLAGYWKSFFRREEQIDDDEIRRYFGSHRRILRNYWLYLKSLKKRPKSHQP